MASTIEAHGIEECRFCRIISRRSFARVVMENNKFVCFFPLHPDSLGHTLIVSREHYQDLRDCPEELGGEMIAAMQALDAMFSGKLGATGFNLLSANGRAAQQSVDHLHLHFMPRWPDDGLDTWPRLECRSVDLDELLTRLHSD